ncbi:DUF1653 domain-containing protein [Streptomyces sp. SID13726]|uniref:DUF1653 domain-containing protein n=1 Tax=Streptomyces sp. SID13726 TaxID=2706058 RepID=UPI0013B9E015|nr:DUF1653 domain-containing protein [Streptomyces sp. SID13726]NEB00299.1 DUF1653 domain-containing protein [Streptomyces sp. SID13726]
MKPNQTYRHYKGNEYRIVALGKHTETGEELVVYQALYGDGQVWVRPQDVFLSEVNFDGATRPRFHLTGEAGS